MKTDNNTNNPNINPINLSLTPLQAVILWRFLNYMGSSSWRAEVFATRMKDILGDNQHSDLKNEINMEFSSARIWNKLDNDIRGRGIDPYKFNPNPPAPVIETLKIGNQTYNKKEVEEALKGIKPI